MYFVHININPKLSWADFLNIYLIYIHMHLNGVSRESYLTLTFMTLSYWAKSEVSMLPIARMPALLTRTSSRPKRLMVCSTVFLTVSSSVRSPGTSRGCRRKLTLYYYSFDKKENQNFTLAVKCFFLQYKLEAEKCSYGESVVDHSESFHS